MLTAPSRLKDDFQLELRLSPPQQREEDALRDFVVWLRQVPAVNQPAGPASAATPEEFAAAIRQAANLIGSPLGSPLDYMFGSPPSYTFGTPPTSLRIPAARYAEYMRLAFQMRAPFVPHPSERVGPVTVR